jgi:hypothetical protein
LQTIVHFIKGEVFALHRRGDAGQIGIQLSTLVLLDLIESVIPVIVIVGKFAHGVCGIVATPDYASEAVPSIGTLHQVGGAQDADF